MNRKSIGRENAIALAETKWWIDRSSYEIAYFTMLVEELCLPFDVFHQAITDALGRPVYTHEFGLNWDGLWEELNGERTSPTVEEIINLIPKEKLLIVIPASPQGE